MDTKNVSQFLRRKLQCLAKKQNRVSVQASFLCNNRMGNHHGQSSDIWENR